MQNLRKENYESIRRLALHRCYENGSVYSTVNDSFIKELSITNLKPNISHLKEKLSVTCLTSNGCHNELNKVKILGLEKEFEFSLLLGLTEENNFIKFLRDNHEDFFRNPRLKKALFKIELPKSIQSVDLEGKYPIIEPLYSQIIKEKYYNDININELFVVTKITYGVQIVAVFLYDNIRNQTEEEINSKFNILKKHLERYEEYSFSGLDRSFLDNLKVRFFANINNSSCRNEFDGFISLLKELKTIKEYKPIEYELTPFCELMRKSFKRHICLEKVYDHYELCTNELETLYRKWQDIDSFSDYFDDNTRKSIKQNINDLQELKNELSKKLSKEVKLVRNHHVSLICWSIEIIEKIRAEIKKKAISWKNLEPNPAQLQDIRFFRSLDKVRYLEAEYDGKKIPLKPKSVIFCYTLDLKAKNPKLWKECFCDFMYLFYEISDCSFYIVNYDICKPLNINYINEIKLIQLDEYGNQIETKSDSSKTPPIDDENVVRAKSETENITDKEMQQPKVDPNINEIAILQSTPSRKNDINIVLLGETGVGKSTFVNAFYNYIRFASLEQALRDPLPKYLIESSFHFTDDNYKTQKITVGDMRNETFKTGESSTQNAKAHCFDLNGRTIRIIDTPGMGDSRGHVIDQKNFEKTIDFLAKFDHINAICFLIKPNNVRLNPGFRYCFKELLSHLHKNTTRNLVFCFTNTRGTQYRPGDTFQSLNSFLKEIEQASNVSIPFSKENIFCVDNEAFRCLILKNNDIPVSSVEISNFSNSWKHSSESSMRMIDYVKDLHPLETRETILLNDLQNSNDQWSKLATELVKTLVSKKNELLKSKEVQRVKRTKPQSDNYNRGSDLERALKKVNQLLKSLLETCSLLSNLMRLSSISVFNDNFEAYLEEIIRESNQRMALGTEDDSIFLLYKEVLEDFQFFKKTYERRYTSEQIKFDTKLQVDLVANIFEIDDDYKKCFEVKHQTML